MGYVPGFRHDVFISYAHVDDAPELWRGGWVRSFRTRLEGAMKMQLALRSDQTISVFLDEGASGNERTSDLLARARNSAIFLAIGSRTYIARDFTLQELNSFAETNPSDKRYFVVEVLPLLMGTSYPPRLAKVIRTRFYDPPKSDEGSAMPISPEDDRFNSLVNDISGKICAELRKLVGGAAATVGIEAQDITHSTPSAIEAKKTVLLAQTSEDREETAYAQRARRYLETEGFRVLPDGDYPQGGAQFEQAFTEDAEEAELFIQLLGRQPGRRPRDLPVGYIQRQAEIAQALGLATMQWRPLSLNLADVDDRAHAALLNGASVRLESFDTFMQAVVDRLQTPPKVLKETATIAQVYVPFHSLDEGFGRIVHDEFARRGISVLGPLTEEFVQFGASVAAGQNGASRAREFLDKTLVNSDAIVLVYGNDPFWALDQATYYVRKRVDRRQALPRAEVICMGPPPGKPNLPITTPFFRVIDCSDNLQPLRDLIDELIV